jgi:hypothetical protein
LYSYFLPFLSITAARCKEAKEKEIEKENKIDFVTHVNVLLGHKARAQVSEEQRSSKIHLQNET